MKLKNYYLKQIIWNDTGDRLGVTTINKHHSRIKAVLNDAISRGDMQSANKNTY